VSRDREQVGAGCSAGRASSSRPRFAMRLLSVAFSIGFGFWAHGTTAQASANSEGTQKTFVGRDGSFRFRYPASLILCGKNTRKKACLTYMPICDENAAACVAYPSGRYSGYNFEGAAFSVNELPQADTQSKCLDSITPPVHTESFNGVDFQASHQGSAGAGHGLSEYSFRSFSRGACYELDIRIATSSLGGDVPGAIKEFTQEDEDSVRASLGKVLSSFEFMK
jgi:hypothetical protein